MNQFIERFKNFFRPLTGAQKVLFVLFSVSILALMSMLFYWAFQPNYTVLFGSLSSDSAQTIVEELESMGVSYELRDNGQSIMVPRDRVYNLRLQFAEEGSAGSDYQGYELFNQNTLGMTDFMQRINKKRALEGELARTINSMNQVETSRIHIVMPERTPFQESTVEASASVFLNLKRGKTLGKDQIQGIGALISGSIEGLSSENVVVLDQNGNRISEDVLMDQNSMAGTASMRLRQSTEQYLTNKGQTMLDRVLGPGKSVIRISTEHNFDKVMRESENIDPDSRVVISEETRNSINATENQEPLGGLQAEGQTLTTNQQQDESTVQVRNYEVSNSRETLEKSVGEIEQISASILLDYKTETNINEEGEEVTTTEPYTEEEVEELNNVMAGALGIQPERGDFLTIKQIKFQDPFSDPTNEVLFRDPLSVYDYFRWGLIAIVVLVVCFMIYRMQQSPAGASGLFLMGKNNRSGELPKNSDNRYLEGETQQMDEDIYTKKLSDKAKEMTNASEAAEEIKNYVENNTGEAASYVRSMMRGVLDSEHS